MKRAVVVALLALALTACSEKNQSETNSYSNEVAPAAAITETVAPVATETVPATETAPTAEPASAPAEAPATVDTMKK